MQLTRQTDFALRTMIYLAMLPPGERVQIKTICDIFDISSNHLSKVVNKLANLGYIDSLRGRGGGICLGMSADSINIGALVRITEPTLNPINCLDPPCQLFSACRFKSVLADASAAFMSTLDSYCLADMVTEDLQALKLIG